MNRQTGQAIEEDHHIAQSIGDILSTRLGTRLERRTYGSEIPNIIDAPFNQSLPLKIMAAATMAIMKWEPRLYLMRIQLVAGEATHKGILILEAIKKSDQRQLNLNIPLNLSAINTNQSVAT